MSQTVGVVLFVAGRVILASLFILAGISKIFNYESVLANMESVGLTPAVALLPLTIALEIIGGLLVAVGRRFAISAALALAVFTAVVNFMFHPFWTFEGAEATMRTSLFMKNVSVMGGLIAVAGFMLIHQRK